PADGNAVVELLGETKDFQMRADLAHLRPDELAEASGIKQQPEPRPRRGLVPASHLLRRSAWECLRGAHCSSSAIRRAACARRSETVSGRAPPSLIENFSPPGEWRST